MPANANPGAAVCEPKRSSLAEHHLDEAWLERWIQQDPKRLGLGGSIRIARAQLYRPAGSGGGRLDLQAIDDALEDRVYDVELMRGELDANHGFRALDYWAREQRNDESDREHRPVIIAERIRGSRYWALLEALSEKLGLIALEIRCVVVEGKPVVWLEPALLPEDLEPDRSGDISAARASLTEADWRSKTTDDFQRFLEAFAAHLKTWGLHYTTVWSAKSYVGLWKGSRCWCPIWPRKDSSGRIYLPAPSHWRPGNDVDIPPEFEPFQKTLQESGVSTAWAWTYNRGSNSIALTIRADQLDNPLVHSILEESWQALP